ncbi:hypothetical protein B7C51_22605 [Paenibacillus larvae subsp. pulvifaciens]|uniref:Uncharacterized protein n=1 Tax=Paenibacillus larvae subsp. pulvifaciens TaxID=1477 RepID=A0A1V0UY13_9BACL|nr:hypothetical protein [Paenibacillus larvae]ARF70043.1 hypothetical protein B7C51_22605 [Paenibacillus larvae subsp. pulvifaciens]
MRTTWTLFWALFKNSGFFLERKNKKEDLKLLLLVLFIVVGLIPLAYLLFSFISNLHEGLAQLGQQGILLGIGITAGSFIVFIFGIYYVMNVFYFAQDVEVLLPLPLRPWQIVTAKFMLALLYEYLTLALLFGPLLIVYGWKGDVGLFYWPYALIIFLALPIIPLLLASFISMFIMRITNISKHKDFFGKIGGILVVALTLGINLGVRKVFNGNLSQEQLESMLQEGSNSFLQLVTRALPTAKYSSLALIESAKVSGLLYLLFNLVITAAIFVCFAYLGEKLYFKGVKGLSESGGKGISLSRKELSSRIRQSSRTFAYMKKELRILYRTPVFFTNCVLQIFIWPVLLFFPVLFQSKDINIHELSLLIQNSNLIAKTLGISLAVMMFLTGAMNVSSTSISREGRQWVFNKVMPVRVTDLLKGKIAASMALIATGLVMLLTAAWFVLHPPFWLLLLLFVLGLLSGLFSSLTGISIDLRSPKLNWDNEVKAVKQNWNSFFNMMINLAVAGIFLFLTFTFSFSLTVLVILFATVLTGLIAGTAFLLHKYGDRWFHEIEE